VRVRVRVCMCVYVPVCMCVCMHVCVCACPSVSSSVGGGYCLFHSWFQVQGVQLLLVMTILANDFFESFISSVHDETLLWTRWLCGRGDFLVV